MAYAENPIQKGVDFKSIATDVNGNFEDIKDEISQTNQAFGKWEFIGEIDIIGTPDSCASKPVRYLGEECGSISFEGNNYEKLLLILTGHIGGYTQLKTGALRITDNGDKIYPDLSTGELIYHNIGGSAFTFTAVPYSFVLSCSSGIDFYWNYTKDLTPTKTEVNIKLYGQKKPQALLDMLGITTE